VNRLQKKCFVASAGVHLLLAVILLIGPGFLPSKNSQDDLPLLTFVPITTVDEAMSGGGNPKAAQLTPAPQPPQPQPPAAQPPAQPQPQPVAQPEPQKARQPDPPKDVKPVKQEEASVEPVKERQPHKVEISKTLVTRQKDRDPSADKRAREQAEAQQQAKALADARHRLARQIGKAADQIGNEVSSGTAIEMLGPGGGGPTYANFYQAVKSAYDRAWLLPDGAVDDEAITVALVTIARDGTVVSHRIIHRSGDSIADNSVQITLDRVTYAAPLPGTCKENTRTVSIKFSVRAKRSLG
jgi:outer membrane biosynthesis protein TonB